MIKSCRALIARRNVYTPCNMATCFCPDRQITDNALHVLQRAHVGLPTFLFAPFAPCRLADNATFPTVLYCRQCHLADSASEMPHFRQCHLADSASEMPHFRQCHLADSASEMPHFRQSHLADSASEMPHFRQCLLADSAIDISDSATFPSVPSCRHCHLTDRATFPTVPHFRQCQCHLSGSATFPTVPHCREYNTIDGTISVTRT